MAKMSILELMVCCAFLVFSLSTEMCLSEGRRDFVPLVEESMESEVVVEDYLTFQVH